MEVRMNCPSGCETVSHLMNCGTQVYVLPKKRNINIGAVVIGFGAADIKFKYKGKDCKIPQGTAHFLEHQMFEMPYGNAASRFTALGAESNAFTDAGKTVYYFKTAGNFTECLRLLLEFVTTPYFMKESIETEKSIIKNEIAMYDDEPGWRAFFTSMKQLYPDSPIADEIAGSAESVDSIDADILNMCHSAFYTPDNMTVVCSGDVCAETVLEVCRKALDEKNKSDVCVQPMKYRPTGGSASLEMYTQFPKFCISYPIKIGADRAEEIFMLRLVAEAVLSEGSDFFKSMSEKGIMSEPPSAEVYEHNSIGYLAVSGTAKDADTAAEAIKKAIKELKEKGLDNKAFEREFKKLKGGFVRMADSCESAAMTQAEFRALPLAALAERIGKITPEKTIRAVDDLDNLCGVCIVRPHK